MSEETQNEETKLSATMTIKLRADSGFTSDEQHRISASQWGRICEILYEKHVPAAPK